MKFKLITNCFLVKGANRSAIYDPQRTDMFMVPNELANAIPKWENKTKTQIKAISENEIGSEEIEECITFLLEEELAFFTETPEWFPKMNLQWDAPFRVTNAIIDINKTSAFEIQNALYQLDELNCKHLQIRFFKEVVVKDIEEIIFYLNELESIITSVNFVFPFNTSFKKEAINKLRFENTRLSSMIIYGHKKDEFLAPIDAKRGYVILSKKNINSKIHCGVISSQFFAINIKSFTESQHYNSCLNRKISIDINGDIKNCPSMPQSYGNINDTTLEEALNKPGFKKYWNITKDDIEVCRDCEFRYVCTDCRAYTERTKFNKEGLDLSKPLKCGYNPYTNEWAEWSTNPLKEKAIAYYGMQELVKDNKAEK